MKSTLFGALLMASGTIAGSCLSTLATSNHSVIPFAAAHTAKPLTAGFNADIYLMAYPDVAKQIKAGKFKSALDHYKKVGQSGKDANGEAIGGFFTGTDGNDTVTGFGQAPHLAGVQLEVVVAIVWKPLRTWNLIPKSLGNFVELSIYQRSLWGRSERASSEEGS